ncbi:Predicted dehydrogenase [Thermomonospora echinospora]|uniref:Predicted dehydrogenase n=2 Tax=Thermomonospora echinospora TaxID=1992 RepID=A0A1H6E834_9ACTN|nr:Predicted dehydrogenase [Thermomonospora echinospora]
MVAHEYACTLARSRLIELAACTDIDSRRADSFAEHHHIPTVAPLDDLLIEHAIDLLVILTPPDSHVQVARTAIEAGVHVHLEKPLALDVTEAERLLTFAAQQQVKVGAAPDTFLAPPTQTAAAAIGTGAIGEPLFASAALLSGGPERWHPAPQPFYAPRMGPLLDMGPYYLTQLTHLLGPITQVEGATATTRPHRTIATGPQAGHHFTAQAFTHVEALLKTASGIPVTFTASFDATATARPHLEINGTEGTLILPDPNFHHGPVQLRRSDSPDWHTLAPQTAVPETIGRGMGVLDTAQALRTDRPTRGTGEQALHVLHVLDLIYRTASNDERHTSITLRNGKSPD